MCLSKQAGGRGYVCGLLDNSYMRVPAGQKRLERPADTGMKAGLVECVTACPASHSCWVLRDIRFQRRECRREQATGTLSPGQDGAPGGGRSVPLRRRLRTARRMVGAAGGSRAELGSLSCVAQPGPCVNTRCPSVCTDVQKPPFQRASVCLSVCPLGGETGFVIRLGGK